MVVRQERAKNSSALKKRIVLIRGVDPLELFFVEIVQFDHDPPQSQAIFLLKVLRNRLLKL